MRFDARNDRYCSKIAEDLGKLDSYSAEEKTKLYNDWP
jgi:hypothetical protein